jgi:predicted RNA binding protein YcfA (HicA-like mRNA interferase family)
MPSLPALTPKDLIRIILKKGFLLDRTKGSHQIFMHPENHKRVVVPMHKHDLPKGTIFAILKQAGIDKKDIAE